LVNNAPHLSQIELGDGKEKPSEETAKEINKLLKELKDGFQFE
jgi:hypothetical protein